MGDPVVRWDVAATSAGGADDGHGEGSAREPGVGGGGHGGGGGGPAGLGAHVRSAPDLALAGTAVLAEGAVNGAGGGDESGPDGEGASLQRTESYLRGVVSELGVPYPGDGGPDGGGGGGAEGSADDGGDGGDNDTPSASSSDDDSGVASHGKNGPAVGVITIKVKRAKLPQYERWQKTIISVCEQFKGFIRKDRQDFSIDDKYVGISTLLYFDTEHDLQHWNSSVERKTLVNAAEKLGIFCERHVGTKDRSVPWAELSRFESSAAKAPKVLPPPKWKLWLVIWFCVITCNLAFTEALVREGLTDGGWLDFEPALFAQLFITVTFISFAFSPFLTAVQFRGYGLAAWLKMPRLKVGTGKRLGWHHTRIVLAGVVEVAQSGFSLLNPPPDPPMSAELLHRIDNLEGQLEAFKRHTTERLREVRVVNGNGSHGHGNHGHVDGHGHHADVAHGAAPARAGSVDSVGVGGGGGPDGTAHPPLSGEQQQRMRKSLVEATETALHNLAAQNATSDRAEQEPISITIHHRVRWECVEEFRLWQARIIEAMSRFEGYLSSRLIVPSNPLRDNLFTLIFRFDSLEHLGPWMYSEERMGFLLELQPMLVAPDVVSALHTRQLPDVFSDQLVPQGAGASRRAPPKWKVVVITAVALFFTVWPLSWHLPRHLNRWGLVDAHARTLVSTGFSTSVNMWLTAPFFTNLFGYWLTAPPPAHYAEQPWKLLDSGLKSPWSMAFVVFVVFLSCGLKINADDEGWAV